MIILAIKLKKKSESKKKVNQSNEKREKSFKKQMLLFVDRAFVYF